MTRPYLGPALLLGVLTACTAQQPAPPAFEDTDPCTLLAAGDAGALSGTPARTERACDYPFDSLRARLTLETGEFADASQELLAGGGYGAVIGDRPMTRRCDVDSGGDESGEVTCDAVVEVRDGQLIRLKVVQRSHDANAVGQVTQSLAGKALGRVPVTS
ncbi:hypothetical protein [Lentzea xinjiangensis]|uniref:hypothetical protein n=1 Tax=Lentzea xinjiangensis TaxID=402600 RepID=UPI001160E012|nr:hypothetical protein [Lentzea xinjiangensis]